GVDREPGRAVAQPLLGASERLGEDGGGQKRKGAAQRLEALHQEGNREHRVDRQRDFRLDVRRHAFGAGADGPGARDQRARVADQRPPGIGQLRRLAGAVEQAEAECRLERLDRLADRRLDPPELSRRGGKASGIGDSDQNPHLVERERVDHPSPPPIDISRILPIATIGPKTDIFPRCNNSRAEFMTIHVPEQKAVEATSLARIFTEARTHNAFLDRPVPDELLVKAVDLAKMGPTSANQSPMRVLFLRSREARERLRPALSPGNLNKTMSAPVVAITAFDEQFYEHLPFLFPHADAKSWFSGNPAFAARA